MVRKAAQPDLFTQVETVFDQVNSDFNVVHVYWIPTACYFVALLAAGSWGFYNFKRADRLEQAIIENCGKKTKSSVSLPKWAKDVTSH